MWADMSEEKDGGIRFGLSGSGGVSGCVQTSGTVPVWGIERIRIYQYLGEGLQTIADLLLAPLGYLGPSAFEQRIVHPRRRGQSRCDQGVLARSFALPFPPRRQ